MDIKSAQVIADVVEAAHNRGVDVLVANMPDGQTRLFVDAASKIYQKKRRTIMPERYVMKGKKCLGVWKMKRISNKAAEELKEKIKAGDAEARIRLVNKDGQYYIKTGKLVTMKYGRYQKLIMQMRRAAGWEPVHHRPNTRPKIGKALRAWHREHKDDAKK